MIINIVKNDNIFHLFYIISETMKNDVHILLFNFEMIFIEVSEGIQLQKRSQIPCLLWGLIKFLLVQVMQGLIIERSAYFCLIC